VLNIQRLGKDAWSYYSLAELDPRRFPEARSRWEVCFGEREKEMLFSDLSLSFQGINPVTHEDHSNPMRSNAAYDLVFSAPKSMSLLFGFCDDTLCSKILEIHNAAVSRALQEISANLINLRRFSNGSLNFVKPSGLAMGRFVHCYSRNLDPHLHSHIIIPNFARGEDGKWSALDMRLLYKSKFKISRIYQENLRNLSLEKLNIIWKPNYIGLADVAGISRDLISSYSTRSEEIKSSLKEKGIPASTRSKKIAFYSTRRKKISVPDIDEARAIWRNKNRENSLIRSIDNIARALNKAELRKSKYLEAHSLIELSMREFRSKSSVGIERELF
jgi:conjugative relaxase-like TrwC/TraI family protein